MRRLSLERRLDIDQLAFPIGILHAEMDQLRQHGRVDVERLGGCLFPRVLRSRLCHPDPFRRRPPGGRRQIDTLARQRRMAAEDPGELLELNAELLLARDLRGGGADAGVPVGRLESQRSDRCSADRDTAKYSPTLPTRSGAIRTGTTRVSTGVEAV